jgi:hypothetical protein
MAVRAVVIAIEDYPKVQGGGIAKSLPGTLKAGLDFKDWLLEKWEVELLEKWKAEEPPENETQLIFCQPRNTLILHYYG